VVVEVCGSTRTRGYTRTRPVPAGTGRVRVDVLRVGSGTGTKTTGRVYPFLPVEKAPFFTMLELYRMFFYFFLFSERKRVVVRLSSVVCLSVVCNVRAPYSGDEIFGNVSTPFNTMAIR